MQLEGEPAALSPVQSLTASWILREATTNILRHAGAKAVTVRIAPGRFAVIDDGQGKSGGEGNGVRGMRERATTSGASFTIAPAPGHGTKVEVIW